MARNSHGLPSAPRPIMTASQPVSSRMREVVVDGDDVAVADDRDVRRHCLAHLADDRRDRDLPEKPCVRVRPCTVIIAAPASTIAQANSGAFRWRSSQPARCFTVTGMSAGTAARTARTSSCASSGSFMSAEPQAPATTRLAGQPMLMSTSDAPMSTAICAALGERLGFAAEDLHAEAAAVERRRHLVERLLGALDERVRREELGDRDADAELFDDRAKRQIGDRRHRCEQDIRLDGEVPDAHSGCSIAYQQGQSR